jgi:hypothetical protein
VLHDVARERIGQVLEADRRLARGAQVDQAFRKGEFVRGGILAKEDDGAPIVLKRTLLVQEVRHDKGVLYRLAGRRDGGGGWASADERAQGTNAGLPCSSMCANLMDFATGIGCRP